MFSRYVLIKPPKPCGKKVGRVTTLDSRFMTIYCSIQVVWLNSGNSLKVNFLFRFAVLHFCLPLSGVSCTSLPFIFKVFFRGVLHFTSVNSGVSCTSLLFIFKVFFRGVLYFTSVNSGVSCTSLLLGLCPSFDFFLER